MTAVQQVDGRQVQTVECLKCHGSGRNRLGGRCANCRGRGVRVLSTHRVVLLAQLLGRVIGAAVAAVMALAWVILSLAMLALIAYVVVLVV